MNSEDITNWWKKWSPSINWGIQKSNIAANKAVKFLNTEADVDKIQRIKSKENLFIIGFIAVLLFLGSIAWMKGKRGSS